MSLIETKKRLKTLVELVLTEMYNKNMALPRNRDPDIVEEYSKVFQYLKSLLSKIDEEIIALETQSANVSATAANATEAGEANKGDAAAESASVDTLQKEVAKAAAETNLEKGELELDGKELKEILGFVNRATTLLSSDEFEKLIGKIKRNEDPDHTVSALKSNAQTLISYLNSALATCKKIKPHRKELNRVLVVHEQEINAYIAEVRSKITEKDFERVEHIFSNHNSLIKNYAPLFAELYRNIDLLEENLLPSSINLANELIAHPANAEEIHKSEEALLGQIRAAIVSLLATEDNLLKMNRAIYSAYELFDKYLEHEYQKDIQRKIMSNLDFSVITRDKSKNRIKDLVEFIKANEKNPAFCTQACAMHIFSKFFEKAAPPLSFSLRGWEDKKDMNGLLNELLKYYRTLMRS